MSAVGLDTRICAWCARVLGDNGRGFVCGLTGEVKQRYDTCGEWARLHGGFI